MPLIQRGIYIDSIKVREEISSAQKKIDDFLKRENNLIAKRYFLGKRNILFPLLDEFEALKNIDFQKVNLDFQKRTLKKLIDLNHQLEIEIINFEIEEQKRKLEMEIKDLSSQIEVKKDELDIKDKDITIKQAENNPFLQKAIDDKNKIEKEISLLNDQINKKKEQIKKIVPQIELKSSLEDIFLGDTSPPPIHGVEHDKLEYVERCLAEIESILLKQKAKKFIIIDDSALLKKPVIIIDLLRQFDKVIVPELVIEILKFQAERGRFPNKEYAKQALDIFNTIDPRRVEVIAKQNYTVVSEQIKILALKKAKEDSTNEVFILSENPSLGIPDSPENLRIIKSETLNSGFQPTKEQHKVLNLKEGLHLVLAPPGSGKTELLAHRVYDAKDDGYEDNDIICLTFTNRAAKGMKERVEQKYANNRIMIGNFHKYAINFLKENRLIPLNVSILDEEEQDQIIEEIKERHCYNYRVYNPDLIKLSTYLKQKSLGFPGEVFLEPKDQDIPELHKAEDVCKAYQKEKEDNGYLDFDDLLTLTYYHLTNTNKTKLKLAQFKWIQVDEIQDLNNIQWAILREITALSSVVVYFGDYEQAIFSFMGAKLESLHTIEQEIKQNLEKNSVLNLSLNFRSPSYLLDIYVKYAETHWRPSWKQTPFAHKQKDPPGDALRLFKISGTETNEANYIAQHIMPILLHNDEKTAIIVKENKPADVISAALKQRNVPHFKISGFDLFRRKSVKGLMAFLSILYNEYNRLSWARIFKEFKVLPTLKECRSFVNGLFAKGLTPLDILGHQNIEALSQNMFSSRSQKFFNTFSEREMVVFDTETTGLDTKNDDIIQIAAVKIVKGKIQDTFEVYIKTDKDISKSEEVHHISQKYLKENGVEAKEGLLKFMEFCGRNCVLVAHNIKFDYEITNNNLTRYTDQQITDYCNEYFDSIEISKLLYPNFTSYKLEDLIGFLKVEGVNSHNALDDVKATVSLIERLNFDFRKLNQKEYLSNEDNSKIFKRLNDKFKPVHSIIYQDINTYGQLRSIIDKYFEFNTINDEEKAEVEKLTKHLDFYTNIDYHLTLKEKIRKYIPEYILYKESDLYLGHEQILVSTVYKAKGLEFDNVVIADATDNMYPRLWMLEKQLRNTHDASERQRIQEQIIKKSLEDARAFYVALTRSKQKLYITYTVSNTFPRRDKSEFIDCIEDKFIVEQI